MPIKPYSLNFIYLAMLKWVQSEYVLWLTSPTAKSMIVEGPVYGIPPQQKKTDASEDN